METTAIRRTIVERGHNKEHLYDFARRLERSLPFRKSFDVLPTEYYVAAIALPFRLFESTVRAKHIEIDKNFVKIDYDWLKNPVPLANTYLLATINLELRLEGEVIGLYFDRLQSRLARQGNDQQKWRAEVQESFEVIALDIRYNPSAFAYSRYENAVVPLLRR